MLCSPSALAIALALGGAPAQAYAQGAPPGPPAAASGSSGLAAPAAPASLPPDLVRRVDGGMLRGTIVELVPGAYVVVTLTTGETRRIPMREVRYAGPVANDPGAAVPPATGPGAAGLPATGPGAAAPPATGSGAAASPATGSAAGAAPPLVPAAGGDEVAVAFEADRPDVTLQLRSGETQVLGHTGGSAVQLTGATYRRLCTAPCGVTLPRGAHRMALSQGGGEAVEVEASVRVEGPSTLRGQYRSNEDWRTTGLIVGGLGIATGLAVAFSPLFVDEDAEKAALVRVPVGVGVFVASIVVGGFLLPRPDEAKIIVVPYTPPRAPAAPGSGAPDAASGLPQALPGGLAVAGRF